MLLNLLLNKWVIGGVLLIAVASGAFYKGYKLASEKADREIAKLQLESLKQNLIERDRVSEIVDKVDKRLDELRANEKVIEREKLKIVDRPVYRNQCLDDDGVSLINQARLGKARVPDSSETKEPLPDTPRD